MTAGRIPWRTAVLFLLYGKQRKTAVIVNLTAVFVLLCIIR